jgi:hypothetical protein
MSKAIDVIAGGGLGPTDARKSLAGAAGCDPERERNDDDFYKLIGEYNGVFGCMSLLGCHDSARKNCRWLRRSHSSDGRWPRRDGSDEETLRSAFNYSERNANMKSPDVQSRVAVLPKKVETKEFHLFLAVFMLSSVPWSCSYGVNRETFKEHGANENHE